MAPGSHEDSRRHPLPLKSSFHMTRFLFSLAAFALAPAAGLEADPFGCQDSGLLLRNLNSVTILGKPYYLLNETHYGNFI